MRVKVSRQQLEGVVLIVSIMLNDNKPNSILEKLIYTHVLSLFQKMRKKMEVITYPRSGWAITMSELEAMALHSFYANVFVDREQYTYEAINLERVINKIDIQYGRVVTLHQGDRSMVDK